MSPAGGRDGVTTVVCRRRSPEMESDEGKDENGDWPIRLEFEMGRGDLGYF